MLALRILSAIIGIPLVLTAVYFGGPWYALFILLLVNLGIFEYNRMILKESFSFPVPISHLGVSLFVVVFYFQYYVLVFPLVMFILFLLFVSALLDMENKSIATAALSFWGVLYIGGFFGYLLLLRSLEEGMYYTLMLLAGIWIHDSAAYFIGVKWGMRKFAPQISPNKSLEGSIAGAGSVVVIFFSLSILLPDIMIMEPGAAALFALGVSVFAQLGDLMESALKRQLEVKDTGKLIPGHGGVLDRFDSLMLTAPFAYYYFILLTMI